MTWPWFFFLLVVSGVYMFTQERFFPDYSFIEPTLIACFLILRSSSRRKILLMTFIFSMCLDFLCLGSQIKGVTTLSVLPLVYLGTLLKEYILPAFSDMALFVYFIACFLLNYFMVRWLFGAFGASVPEQSFLLVLFQVLVHTDIFGGVLIFLSRFKGKGL